MKPHFKALLSGFTRKLLERDFLQSRATGIFPACKPGWLRPQQGQKDTAQIEEKLFAMTSERFWKKKLAGGVKERDNLRAG